MRDGISPELSCPRSPNRMSISGRIRLRNLKNPRNRKTRTPVSDSNFTLRPGRRLLRPGRETAAVRIVGHPLAGCLFLCRNGAASGRMPGSCPVVRRSVPDMLSGIAGFFSAAAGGLGAERFFQTLSGRCVKSTQSVLFSARRTPGSVRKWGCRLQEFVK